MSNEDLIKSMVGQISVYNFKQRIIQDISLAVSSLPTLKPTVSTLTHDNGKRSTLVNLSGTIPMYYKGGKYNIPVCIWVVELYPYHPPICYVTPTQNMMIKPRHKHVDSAGRCYLPYLTDWQAKTSTIYEMINYMSAIFGNDPPVYQKPTTTNVQNQSVYKPQQQQPQKSLQQQQSQPQQSSSSSSFFGIPSFFQSQPKTEDLLTKKVTENVEKYKNDAVREIDDAMKKQVELNQRSAHLEEAFKQLETDKRNCVEAINYFDQKGKEIDIWLSQHNDELDIDQVVAVSDEQSQQILELVAMDHSIDDAVYYLDKALEKKMIEFDKYIEIVREISKKQFMQKALLKKIATGK
eukprot:gene7835-12309_t